MREFEDLLDLGLQVLRESGAPGGEIYLEEQGVFSVAVSGGAVESLETQEVRGAGLRLFAGGRVAFGYTTDLSPEGLRVTVARAKEMLSHADPHEANRLPEADASHSPDPEIHDPSLTRVEPHEKILAARRMEEAARETDPRIGRVRQSRYTDVIGRTGVANTGGLKRFWPFTRIYASIELNAGEGEGSQSGWFADFAVRFSALDAAAVGREAARRALQKLGGQRTATRRANLVLDPVVAASLLESISPALHADNVLKGKSLLASSVDREVAGPRVTLLDDGRISGGDHSTPWDAEGVATRCTMLIEGGVLKGFLHSSYTSVRIGAAPTGNAFRSSFKSPPQIAPSTLYLEPTGVTREALLKEAGDGIYITEVMGLHTIDPISGDFSLGAGGVALHEGRQGEPLERIGIAGNILDLLRSINGVADDLRFMPGGGAGSSTLLTDISVSGT